MLQSPPGLGPSWGLLTGARPAWSKRPPGPGPAHGPPSVTPCIAFVPPSSPDAFWLSDPCVSLRPVFFAVPSTHDSQRCPRPSLGLGFAHSSPLQKSHCFLPCSLSPASLSTGICVRFIACLNTAFLRRIRAEQHLYAPPQDRRCTRAPIELNVGIITQDHLVS